MQAFYIIITIVIVVAFSFVPSAVVAFPVMECEAHHNSRHQQYISGVSIPAYWLSNYVWDLGIFLVLMVASSLSLQAFQVQVFITLIFRQCWLCTPESRWQSRGKRRI
jgi:ATP-binding cassette subfamily A (ABC1) protein 3